MPAIKSAAEIADKWARVTPQRQTDYESGVKAPLKDWAANAGAAEDSWASGVSMAAGNRSFSKGVRKAGNEKWSRKTVEVGVGRWGAGVRAGTADYTTGFEPMRQTIASTALPPRYPKGDPRNIDRVAAIATALNAKKRAG
jgi:hypothetical protein